MSEYTFGEFETSEEPGLGETPGQQEQGPKWFREGLAKLSGQVKDLQAENDRLKQAQKRTEVEKTLTAKGYAPAAAALFTGEPDQLETWLSANGAALAKLPATPGEEEQGEQAPAGPVASAVPADGQEQMQRMQEQGVTGVAPPQGTDKEIAAAFAAAQTPEDFAKLMRAHGNQFDWS